MGQNISDLDITGPDTIRLGTGGKLREIRSAALQLRVMDGPDRGLSLTLLGAPARVGKSPACELCLTDPGVSRVHLSIELRGEGAHLTDDDSTNGTRVNGARVRESPLRPGDLVQVGGSTLVLETIEVRIPVTSGGGTTFHGLVGTSPAMRELHGYLEAVAPTPLSVVLHGESGCGKEMIARAVHEASPRSGGPFVVFDCASVDPSLVGSHLFGHAAGAFTGAAGSRKGAFMSADGGSLFLDEIGDLSPELQPRLLRVLERREIQPIGSDTTQPVDVRVVSATHRDLVSMIEKGSFRHDLYYRLAGLVIEIPPLRDRTEDMLALARHFLESARPGVALSPDAERALLAHPWPGNVRELKNVVERSAALCPGPVLEAGDIRLDPLRPGTGPRPDRSEGLTGTVEQVEADAIRRALRQAGGNKSEAARTLGIARKTLREKMVRYGIGSSDPA